MARKSRAKWQKGGTLPSLAELAEYIRAQHLLGKTDNQILFYFGSESGRPLNWTVISNMSLRTIEGAIRRGRIWFVEPREAEHGEEETAQVDS